MNGFRWTQRACALCVTLAATAGLLGASDTLALDRPGDTATRRLIVNYSDVNLSTVAGATRLYQRIQGAARFVCGYQGRGLAEWRAWKDCYQQAIAGAVASVNSPLLTAIHRKQSGEGTVTAMLGH
jgi:UrcA family protein